MKKDSLFTFMSVLLLTGILSSTVYSEVKLPSIFGDNMVLQRETEVVIWGWAEAGSKISVTPSWDSKNYTEKTDPSGKWKLKIATPQAGGPYELSISDGKSVILKNILIGEVWLCSGQSNMEMPVKGYTDQPVLGSNDIILKSMNKNIRFISVPRSGKTEPQEDFTGSWKEAAPETVAEFSATAYYFGKLLNKILNVPVGLIDVTYGGSCIQAWMSKNTSVPFEDWQIPEKDDTIYMPSRTPTGLFNGMLYPVIGYGIKGCIWYQGETNHKEPARYEELFMTMVNEWRSLWEAGEFPFYYAQIAPYAYSQSDTSYYDVKLNSAYFREAQLNVMNKISNCGMAVLMDTGEKNCIHPANKEAAGKRLAYWALAKTYGIKGLEFASPVPDSLQIIGDTAILTFKNVPNGLTSFGRELSCFEMAGPDKKFQPARAYISERSVFVICPEIKNPVAVRYAFKDFVKGDLFSTGGLPVSSFRTDNW
jgi:sialate O-acetylesterase